MDRLSFCADEHVPHAFVTALRSNGFSVVIASEARGRTVDDALLTWCGAEGHVLLTNDRDFVEIHEEVAHAGLIIYTSQSRTPGELTRAIRRLDRHFTPDTMANCLVWLGQWL